MEKQEQGNLLSATANDSGVDGCSTSGGTTITTTNTFNNTSHVNEAKNSETTSAIDLSEVNMQEDIPLDDDENQSICDQTSDIFEVNELTTTQPDIAGAIFCNNNQTKVMNRLSSDSGSTFEIVDYTSPESDDWNKILKLTEEEAAVHKVDERDTFSPVNSEDNVSCHLIDETTLKLGNNFTVADIVVQQNNNEDNNLFRRRKYDSNLRSSTKEEKQRQNEEIVILESSSISSETGSWEALFPNNQTEVKESCKTFLAKERNFCDNNNLVLSQEQHTDFEITEEIELREHYDLSKTPNNSRVVSSCFCDTNLSTNQREVVNNDTIELKNDYLFSKTTPNNSSHVTSACFIDASSLLDDDEPPYLSLGPRIPDLGCFTEPPDSVKTTTQLQCSSKTESSQNSPKCLENNDFIINMKENSEPEDEIEQIVNQPSCSLNSFHMVFEKCKPNSNKPQNSEPEINELLIDLESHNGSREDDHSSSLKRQQEYEKLQGNFLFKNSIQQFSGHLISPKMPFSPEIEDESSLSSVHIVDNSNEIEVNNDNGNSMEHTAIVYPDTPHNSIITISTLERRKVMDSNMSSSSSYDQEVKRTPKRIQKCDESAPIVSGGASIKDFSPKLCESPPVRRKVDNCPIVSGGAIFMHLTDTVKSKTKEKHHNLKNSNNSTSLTSWVVDMSDCGNSINNKSTTRLRSELSSSSSHENCLNNDGCSSSNASKNGSLGYFVDFCNLVPPVKSNENIPDKIETPKKIMSTGFFVDLSDNEYNSITSTTTTNSITKTPPNANESLNNESSNRDKKNIFSMFIDFGEKKPVTRREPFSLTSKLSSSLNQKSRVNGKHSINKDDLMSKSVSTIESSEVSSDNDGGSSFNSLTKIEEARKIDDNSSESSGGVIYRRNPNNSFASFTEANFKRHSWNTNPINTKIIDRGDENQPENENKTTREYKRSLSLSADKTIMSILDKIPLISKTSSMSIDSSISPYDDFSCTKSDISIYSNNSHNNDDKRKRRKDAKINETFDKSSQGSITDGIFSKETSPISTTETDDITFQNEINNESSKCHQNSINPLINNQHTMETLQATIEKQKKLLETVTENVETVQSITTAEVSNLSFVKLSDMDKPISNKFELHSSSELMSNSAGSRVAKLFHDQKQFSTSNGQGKKLASSTDRFSWTMSRSTGNNIVNLATSIENTRSLSRLFPHLSKVFSNSLPSDVGLNSIDKSVNEMSEYILSEISYTSSVASSRSGFESADESSMSCRQPRRLGEDLLKMFLQEIATDVTIEVGNRKMRAHKCILRSRCQYFAAILAGGWVQNAGNIITLPGYSYDVVHFALCHIYSGAAHPPEGISLMELAALGDLLGLEGLKEVTAYALRTNYCHNFHKPCSGCLDGIVQVLPVSLNHGLDDLYRKCLKWVCRHYVKVWPTRCFAQLNFDIICRCRQQVVGHMSSENVLNTFLDCENLLATLAPCKWAGNVEHILRELIEISQNYISDHFASLIASDSFLSLGHGNSWNISHLELMLLRTASTLTSDQACKSYQRITRLNTVLGAKVITLPTHNGISSIDQSHHQEEMDWNEEFIRLVSAILSAVEQCLTRQCARAMKVGAWQRLDVDLRKKIQQLACLSEPQVERKSRTMNKLSYNQSGPTFQNRNQDLHQVRLAIQAHNNRRSMSHDNKQYRASAYTQTTNNERAIPQSNLTDKSVQANRDNSNATLVKQLSIPLAKSSSKSQIAEVIVKQKGLCASNQTHRRSQSETIKLTKDKSMTNVPKLSNVKPRYLEPKKINIKKTTNCKLTATSGNRLSSSESSTRTSSPAAKKSLSTKKINESNISLDSLASPAKTAKILKTNKVELTDYSGDSLGESLKSSIKTEKTISHECLVQTRPSKTSLQSNNLSKSNPLIVNKENKLTKNLSATTVSQSLKTKPTNLHDVANRKQRASSLTKQSISENSPVSRRSFLSAKSREILSKRQPKQTTGIPVTKSTSASPVLNEKRIINKSSSSSSVPSSRRVITNGNNSNIINSKIQTATKLPTVIYPSNTNIKLKNNIKNENKIIIKAGTNNIKNNKNEMVEEEIFVEFVIPDKDRRRESKLERSSTFCKESSDIPSSELQIIE